MPPRANKRQQRELDEIAALATTSGHESSEEEIPTAKSRPAFAALLDDDAAAEEEEEEEPAVQAALKSKKPKKKKKAQPTASSGVSQDQIQSTPLKASTSGEGSPGPSKPKPPKSKAAKKAKKDDLEKALEELSIKYPTLQDRPSTSNAEASGSRSSLSKLLAVSLNYLDADAELRRFFGAKVVKSAEPKSSSSHKRTGNIRSQLTKFKPAWAPPQMRDGLSLHELDEEVPNVAELDGSERWWSIEPSKKYKSLTKFFIQTVQSGDPNGFYTLLQRHPYHADTLLQMSEVFSHREEYTQAADVIERALFAYERAFVGSFNFTSGVHRLDFDIVDNRPFFLGVHRYIIDLQRRGCHRTAFEYSRLLLGLDPHTDPHGSLFYLDYLAIKTNMSGWFLEVYDHFEKKGKEQGNQVDVTRWRPDLLPGWAYSRALAIRAEEKDDSDAALVEAIVAFPSVVSVLAAKADIPLPSNISAHPAMRVTTDYNDAGDASKSAVALLSHLYAIRSSPLWKIPETAAWFRSVLPTALPLLPDSPYSTSHPTRSKFLQLISSPMSNLSFALWRHVIVQTNPNYRRLIAFVPPEIQVQRSYSCDPLPPPTMVSAYNRAYFEGVEEVGGGEGGGIGATGFPREIMVRSQTLLRLMSAY
ncbi:DUF654-domain-containing protein [Sistotremastrum niveocremeum HHB9708]|uniref:DUF654-domain-containing protein n=1 Tax=Sistotremastrum niveocremeum HHB9708 TaxID=1314777 RepID=A0A164RVQ7_9AGAM|nr:DUF654-domain-containing protein [Sistotremastrum niveocremeum HHB9708]